MAENPTTAKARQALDAEDAAQREPLRQRAPQEDTHSTVARYYVDRETGTTVDVGHTPGVALPDQLEETSQASEYQDEEHERTATHAEEVRDEHPVPETGSFLNVYAERDNIVHPGPTFVQVVTDEELIDQPLPADASIALNPVIEQPLDEDETAVQRAAARRESIRAERLA